MPTPATLQPMQPVDTLHLFPETLDALLGVLRSLTPEQWYQPTACAGWSVHDVALHLLGGDVGMLSRRRDGYKAASVQASNWDELVAGINAMNAQWVQTARRISPGLLCDLLRLTGDQVNDYFNTLDLQATGEPVSWAGDRPAPVWLDVAREYTERWHHQQHVRDAVGMPGLTAPRYLEPVLNTFAHALPRALAPVRAPKGTTVTFQVEGDVNLAWTLSREPEAWRLHAGCSTNPDAQVTMPADIAWRMFTKGLSPAQLPARVVGDRGLAARVLSAVAIIA